MVRQASPLFLAMVAIATTGTPAKAHSANLTGREIHVADLAVLDPKEAMEVGRLVVGHLPLGQSSLELNADQRAQLLRRRVPGRNLRLLVNGPVRFNYQANKRKDEAGRFGHDCFALRENLEAGQYLTAEKVSLTPCSTRNRNLPLQFDRRVGMLRLSAPLMGGTYLGRIVAPEVEVVAANEILRFTMIDGPVRIERTVRAIQPGRVGQHIFFKTEDGASFSAPLASAVARSGSR